MSPSLVAHLSTYAAYHRDPRNIATHFVGIPMIVLAVATLLSRPALEFGGMPLSAASVVSLATAAWYLRLNTGLGALMALLLLLANAFGAWIAAMPTATWLAVGVGSFVVGWVFQFVGHYWEGRKPAFVDDLSGLIVGPLFVTTEALFMLGLLTPLREAIESRVGGVRHA
jgi:uncharacterized membrane protein YGL010W